MMITVGAGRSRPRHADSRQPVAVAFPIALQVAPPVAVEVARTFAVTPQMFAARPIGTWIVLFSTARFTRPVWFAPPPWLFGAAVAVAPATALQTVGPVRMPAASTFTVTPQTFAATAIGNWTVLPTTATLTRPVWFCADAGAAATTQASAAV